MTDGPAIARIAIQQLNMLGQLGGNGGLASWMGGVITNDDTCRAVAPNTFQAGLQYQMDRRARDFWVAADGATIDAEVLGSRRSPYRQSVQLIRAPNGRLAAAGSCTCPVGLNCKHVVAVLFEYQQRAPTTVGSPRLRPWVSGATLSGPVDPETGGNPAALPTATEAPLPFDVIPGCAAWTPPRRTRAKTIPHRQ